MQVPWKGFVRKFNPSAPRFRTLSRRRLANRASLGRRSDDQRLRRCSSPIQVRSSRESSSKDSPSEDERQDGTTTRDDRRIRDCRWRPSSSAAQSELVDSIKNATCRIQTGPCVHVNGELTRQDLEDVHISPEPSLVHGRANTAFYTLHHENRVAKDRTGNAEVSESPRVKLGTSRREKRGRLTVAEVFADAVTSGSLNYSRKNVRDIPKVGNSDTEQSEPLESRFQDRIYGEEEKDREPVFQDVGNVETSERSEHVINRVATDNTVLKSSEIGNEDRIEIIPREKENHFRENGKISDKKDDVGNSVHSRDEDNIVDKIQAEKRDDRSERPFDGDVMRKRGILSRCSATENNSGPYRMIDECLLDTFNSHDAEQDEPCDDVAVKDVRRRTSALLRSSCTDNLHTEDDTQTVELYRPRLDELDSILLSNEKKIERIVRVTDDITALLSKSEFARHKLDKNRKRVSRDAGHEESYDESSVGESREKPNRLTRSSILEVELRNQDLSVSSTSRTRQSDTKSPGTFAITTITKASCNTKEKNSAESAEWAANDGGSSIDKSDVTSFSNVLPTLSSTRAEATQTRRHHDKLIAHAKDAIDNRCEDNWSRITSTGKSSERAIDCSSPKRRADNLLARIICSWNKSETMDRFVACLLQDEKQSIERKVTSALRESAVAPKTLQQFLDHLREAISIDDAYHNTDTLNILKGILLDLSSRNDDGGADVDDGGATDAIKICSQNIASIVRTEESTPREKSYAELDACEIVEQVVEDPSDFKNHESFELPEHRDGIRSATRSESVPRSRNSNEESIHGMKISGVPKNVSDSINRNLVDEVTGDGEEARFRDVVEPTKTTPPDAIEESSLHEGNTERMQQTTANASSFKDSRGLECRDARSLDLPEHRETQRSIRIATASGSDQSFKNGSGSERNRSLSEAESLKRISEISSDDEENSIRIPSPSFSRTASGGTKRREVMADENAGDAVEIETSENKEDNEKERGQANAGFGAALTRKDVNSIHSLAKKIQEDVGFSRPTYDRNADSPQRSTNVMSNKGIDTVNSRSVDSLRDCVSLHASSNGESSEAKEVGPRNRETSFEDEPTKAGKDEICGDGNRKGENGSSGLSKTAKRDEGRPIAAVKASCDSSFNSTSNLSNTPLDHDGR